MQDKSFSYLKFAIEELKRLSKIEIEEISNLIDKTIKNNIKDENTIGCIFDRMLNVALINFDSVEDLYYKLLNYTRLFNKELADDYEKYFLDDFFYEEDNKTLKKLQ